MAVAESTMALIQLQLVTRALQKRYVGQRFASSSSEGSAATDEPPDHLRIYRLLDAICVEGDALLNRISEDPSQENSTLVPLMNELLAIGQLLSEIWDDVDVDWSKAQVVVELMKDSLHQSARINPKLFPSIFGTFLEFLRWVRPSGGSGLQQMWKAFIINDSRQTLKDKSQQLDALTRSLQTSPTRRAHRQTALDLLSLMDLKSSDIKIEDIEILTKRLEPHRNSTGEVPPIAVDHTQLALLEMALLNTQLTHKSQTEGLRRLLQAAVDSPSYPLLRLVPLMRLAWLIEDNKQDARTILPFNLRSMTSWFGFVWSLGDYWNSISEVSDDSTIGSAVLLRPTLLDQTRRMCDPETRSIKEILEFEENLRSALCSTRQESERTPQAREQYIALLLVSQFRNIALTFQASFSPESFAKLMNAIEMWRVDISKHQLWEIPAAVRELWGQCSDQNLSEALERECFPILLGPVPPEACLLRTTLALVYLALAQLHHFIPSLPIDPLAVTQYSRRFWQGQLNFIEDRISLSREGQKILLYSGDNPSVDLLNVRRSVALSHLQIEEPAPRAPNSRRVRALFSEASQFCSQIIDLQRVKNVLKELVEQPVKGGLQEAALQGSISGFLRRLADQYTDMADLTAPIIHGLELFRFALRLHSHLNIRRASTQARISRAGYALVSQPPILSWPGLRSAVLSNLVTEVGLKSKDGLLVELESLTVQSHAGIDAGREIQAINARYDQIFQLWRQDVELERKELQEGSSIYRLTKHAEHQMTDEEVEEREFKLLFPQYFEKPESQSAAVLVKTPSQNLDPDSRQSIYEMHMQLFGESHPLSEPRIPHTSVVISRFILHPSAPHGLDPSTVAYRTATILGVQSALQQTGMDELHRYDFYRDPNICEARKIVEPIELLERRIFHLLLQWPENMILRNLLDQTHNILSLPLQSPIPKLLAATENLLLQSEDWERYAHSGNTLKSEVLRVIGVVIAWRRSELSCWAKLLQHEEQRAALDVSEWWFRIYEATVAVFLPEGNMLPEAVDDHLKKVSPLLDHFIVSSPLGQFKARIALLQSWSRYCDAISVHSKSSLQGIQRSQTLLNNTVKFWVQFQSALDTGLKSDRAEIESSIQDMIKLASWKDTNVQALRANAQKTHRQLYRSVRKFREVLRAPVDTIIKAWKDEPQRHPHPGEQKQPAFLGTGIELIVNHPRAVNLDSILRTQLRPFTQQPRSQPVFGLISQMKATSTFLSAIVPPSALDKSQRLRFEKELKGRKRKAIIDYMKELRAAGLPQNLKPEVLARQSDRYQLLQSQGLSGQSAVLQNLCAMFDDIEFNHNRLLHLLPNLREAAAQPHTDIGSREFQRSLLNVEASYSMALSSRELLVQLLPVYDRMQRVIIRLRSLPADALIVAQGEDWVSDILLLEEDLLRLHAALDTISRNLKDLHSSSTEAMPKAVTEFMNEIDHIRQTIFLAKTRTSNTCEAIRNIQPYFITHREAKEIMQSYSVLLQVRDALEGFGKSEPMLAHFLLPTTQWLHTVRMAPSNLAGGQVARETPGFTDQCTNAILVIAQNALSLAQTTSSQVQDDYISGHQRTILRLNEVLQLSTLASLLDDCCLVISEIRGPIATFMPSIQYLVVMLAMYLALVSDHILSCSSWCLAFYRLTRTMASNLKVIAEKGFCGPKELEMAGQEADTDQGERVEEGTGMGEGTGKTDISEQIDDESQVEGLRGEDEETRKDEEGGGRDEEDDAFEMENDFAGEVEDTDGNGDKDETSSHKSEEPDDDVGQLDPLDPEALDEKFWDQQQPQEKEEADTTASRTADDGKTEHSEMAGKENDETPQETSDKPDATKPEREDGNGDPEEDEIPLDDTMNQANHEGQLDAEADNGDPLNLPDDIEMAPNTEVDEPEMDEDTLSLGNDSDNEQVEHDEGKDSMDVEESHSEQSPDYTAQPSGEVDEAEAETVEKPQASMPDEGAGTDAQNTEALNPTDGDRLQSNGGQSREKRDPAPKADEEVEPDPNAGNRNEESDSLDEKEAGRDGLGQNQSGPQSGSRINELPNPHRRLGDAIKELRRRIQEISDAPDAEPREDVDLTKNDDVPLEYANDKAADDQALGPAGLEEVSRLRDLQIADEEPKGLDLPLMDLEQTPESVQTKVAPKDAFPVGERSMQNPQPDIPQPKGAEMGPAENKVSMNSDVARADSVEIDQDYLADDVDIDKNLHDWTEDSGSDIDAGSRWQLYERRTRDLSVQLCEQLRLILEPTRTSRLRGDYRTGKRLNMKKIIPYIASDFTKDKIWLRRTKPSQREYQVLIALDDSKSMLESRSISLAFETLALVTKALTRLEVGEVGVIKFGRTVEIVHGFEGQPFNDATGVNILQSFKFDQTATDVFTLVDKSVRMLTDAKEKRSFSSSSSIDMWQLQIIISDGICQDHERLRATLRRAEERRILIVFIILDSLQKTVEIAGQESHSSIMSMNHVSYKNVNGKMEIQMERYLDTFPFEYYVVLRDVSALPEVLCSTLRQFFEKSSEQ